MAEGKFYNKVSLLEEVKRYKTSSQFLDLLYRELHGSKSLLLTGLGARLTAVTSSLTEELWGIDINQGSIDRAEELMLTWDNIRSEEPLKTEDVFMEDRRLKPNFKNCHFYLKRDFPELKNYFDGELASELFLHMDEAEIREILNMANYRLKPNGKFIFTVYTSGQPDSLDREFHNLCSKYGMDGNEFIRDSVINIGKISKILRTRNEIYEENKDRYWLDLEKIRVFPEKEIEGMFVGSGLGKRYSKIIKCGMFPFAHRLVYVLEK